jgi:putative FmdB family regulatory protein
MPLYLYEHDGEQGEACEGQFEVLQGLSEAAFTQCPQCGGACHRVIASFSAVRSTRSILSPQNLERNGFTQYKKAGGGRYEKVCGQGPDTIRRK